MTIAANEPVFDSRELATLIWLLLSLVLLLMPRRTRESLVDVVKASAHPKILMVFSCLVAYAFILIYALARIDVWTTELLSETVFWFFGPAIVLLSKFDDAGKDAHFFRRTAVTSIGVTVAIEFLVNVYPLHLVIELLLVPFLFLLFALLAVAETKPEYIQVKKLVNGVIAVLGFIFLGYAIHRIGDDPRSLATLSNLREYVVPMLLTLGLLPFIYAVAVYSTYDTLFTRLRWQLRADGLVAKHARRKVFFAARLRLSRVRHFASGYPNPLITAQSKPEVDEAVETLKEQLREAS